MKSRLFVGVVFGCLGVFVAGNVFAQVGWQPLASPTTYDLHGVCFIDSETGWVVGDEGVIFHTTDGGDNWIPQTSGVTELLTSVSFCNPGNGVAVGWLGTLLWTADGGTNWNIAQTGSMETYYRVHMFCENMGWACGVNADVQPLVAKTTDGGQTWEFTSFLIDDDAAMLLDIHFISPLTGFATARIYDGSGAIVRTLDGGTTWDPVLTHDNAVASLDFPFPFTGIGTAGGFGYAFRTEDSGDTWEIQDTGPGEMFWGLSSPSLETVTVTGTYGVIRRTEDAGETWTDQESGTSVLLFDVDFADELIGYTVGEEGVILKTGTGGTTSVDENISVVQGFALLPGEPNPFRHQTTIRYSVPQRAQVTLAIYDVSGRRIRTLVSESKSDGNHLVVWDGCDAAGRRMGRGIYLARLKGVVGRQDPVSLSRPLTLLRP